MHMYCLLASDKLNVYVCDVARYCVVHMKYNILMYGKLCHMATSELCELYKVRWKLFSC